MGMNIGFDIFPIIFTVMFCLIFFTIITTIVNGMKENRANNASPVLDVMAEVVTKRGDVHNDISNMNDMNTSSSSTTYYVTFQVESGDRIEFRVKSTEYGMVREGDRGTLKFQGTRFLSFERR